MEVLVIVLIAPNTLYRNDYYFPFGRCGFITLIWHRELPAFLSVCYCSSSYFSSSPFHSSSTTTSSFSSPSSSSSSSPSWSSFSPSSTGAVVCRRCLLPPLLHPSLLFLIFLLLQSSLSFPYLLPPLPSPSLPLPPPPPPPVKLLHRPSSSSFKTFPTQLTQLILVRI